MKTTLCRKTWSHLARAWAGHSQRPKATEWTWGREDTGPDPAPRPAWAKAARLRGSALESGHPESWTQLPTLGLDGSHDICLCMKGWLPHRGAGPPWHLLWCHHPSGLTWARPAPQQGAIALQCPGMDTEAKALGVGGGWRCVCHPECSHGTGRPLPAGQPGGGRPSALRPWPSWPWPGAVWPGSGVGTAQAHRREGMWTADPRGCPPDSHVRL